MQAGTLMPLGDTDSILDEIGYPLQDLLAQYEQGDAPYFFADSDLTEALFRLPGYDVFFITWHAILPDCAREDGITEDELPVTTISAFRRDTNGVTYNDYGRPLPAEFFNLLLPSEYFNVPHISPELP